METLAKLRVKRGVVKGQLTRFRTFFMQFSEGKEFELRERLKKCEELWDIFDTIQSEIELIDELELDTEERVNFENNWYEVISFAKKIINSNEYFEPEVKSHQLQTDSLPSFSCNVKLPTLELPHFNGAYDQWLQFKDTFDSLINFNTSLSNIQKFYYLRSCLKGDAGQVIQALEVSDGNYATAWALLEERFENKRLIVHKHVRAFFELEPITKNSLISLRKLFDSVKRNLRALKSLKQPVEMWDTLLIHIITEKFDSFTKMEWEKTVVTNELPSMQQLYDFLSQRCQLLETFGSNTSNSGNVNNKSSNSSYKIRNRSMSDSKSFISTNQQKTCPFCQQLHSLYNCDEFLKLPIKSRFNEVKNMKLCVNCLRLNHFSQNCIARGCKKCSKKHNTLLHIDNLTDKRLNSRIPEINQLTSSNQTNEQTDIPQSSVTEATITTHCSNKRSEILLSTALVYAIDEFNNQHQIRVLLDTGSMQNFITSEMCRILKWPKRRIDLPIAGINQILTNSPYITEGTIKSKFNAFKVNTSFLVIDKITENLPLNHFSFDTFKIPDNITLADCSFNKPGPIDMLLGVTIFYDLLCIGQIRLQQGHPIMQKTKLGWIISGSIPVTNVTTAPAGDLAVCHLATESIDRKIERFWSIENCDQKKMFNKEEQECEDHFVKTTKREADGRFAVQLPTKECLSSIGDSYSIARKRFEILEKKLGRNNEFKKQYTAFINEYIEMGHMKKLSEENKEENGVTYYLPHHGVFKETSETTKLRVVFDASCKTDTGISLNDCLKVGPTIQEDLFSILVRFRQHNVVIGADICKMYRMVYVQENQRDLQRILWRSREDEDLNTYVLNTVTYGTASAAFLAIRCLQQTGLDNQEKYPEASSVILRDFYVDDLLSGGKNVEEVKKIKSELIQILNQYGFFLRKWLSNRQEILNDIPEAQKSIMHFVAENKTNKTLGITWNSEQDQLEYAISKYQRHGKVTKRIILSTIAQIFDPLGLLGPIIVKAKIIMQSLWQLKLAWDESVPADIFITWTRFYSHIEDINQLKIPRHVLNKNAIKIQLHCFSDSSEKAYGAAIYIRSTDDEGNHQVHLLCAKSRVAPLKKISLPKLELCGALLLSQLSDKVKKAITISTNDIFYYTDSTIVLGWISSESSIWKTFISNRVCEIQSLTDIKKWRHCCSSDNPADIISRGTNANELNNNLLWWQGPKFLRQEEIMWPNGNYNENEDLPERKSIIHTFHSLPIQDIFYKYSSFSKLLRIIAFILRFKNNTSNSQVNKVIGTLKVKELDSALTVLLKLVQSQQFCQELKSLQKNMPVNKNSRLISLNPFIDKSGLIRVGGRLTNANISNDLKHPIILPNNHPFTDLIIRHEHHKHLHAGPQALLATIRTRFWPISGRNAVKNVLRKCVTCFRVRPKSYEQIMGNLPTARVNPTRVFNVCGTDFGGPFEIKSNKLKNCKIIKAYLCIFVCFITRAVHLEVVSDLSTESFLNCLKRFIARRGKCSDIYSDNGSNFIGAANEIRAFAEFINNSKFNDDISNYLSQESINWHFIPPRSPHFGGIWESAIKSAKFHIKRVIGNRLLTYEELETVITQVECCLNSRPICPLSDNPNDLCALTPGHFIIGDSLMSLPEPDLRDKNPNRLNRYQLISQILQHFWTRWSTEYLTTLQQRTKWKIKGPNGIKEGSLVLLREENTPPLKWQLGRVTQLFPGKDNTVRVVNVKTTKGVVKRAIHKLCPLPLDETDNTN